MKIAIFILTFIMSSASLAKNITPGDVLNQVEEAVKVGVQMDNMSSQKCIPLMKKLQPQMRELSTKVLDFNNLKQEKSDALYEATIGATYCVKCLRVSAKKECKKAQKAIQKYKSIK